MDPLRSLGSVPAVSRLTSFLRWSAEELLYYEEEVPVECPAAWVAWASEVFR